MFEVCFIYFWRFSWLETTETTINFELNSYSCLLYVYYTPNMIFTNSEVLLFKTDYTRPCWISPVENMTFDILTLKQYD